MAVVSICIDKYCPRSLSTDQACNVGTMTEGNIPVTDCKHSYYYIHCPDMVKTYQRETKLFKSSRDTNMKELKIRINSITLQ